MDLIPPGQLRQPQESSNSANPRKPARPSRAVQQAKLNPPPCCQSVNPVLAHARVIFSHSSCIRELGRGPRPSPSVAASGMNLRGHQQFFSCEPSELGAGGGDGCPGDSLIIECSLGPRFRSGPPALRARVGVVASDLLAFSEAHSAVSTRCPLRMWLRRFLAVQSPPLARCPRNPLRETTRTTSAPRSPASMPAPRSLTRSVRADENPASPCATLPHGFEPPFLVTCPLAVSVPPTPAISAIHGKQTTSSQSRPPKPLTSNAPSVVESKGGPSPHRCPGVTYSQSVTYAQIHPWYEPDSNPSPPRVQALAVIIPRSTTRPRRV